MRAAGSADLLIGGSVIDVAESWYVKPILENCVNFRFLKKSSDSGAVANNVPP